MEIFTEIDHLYISLFGSLWLGSCVWVSVVGLLCLGCCVLVACILVLKSLRAPWSYSFAQN